MKSARRAVERLRALLVERCGLPADDITVLHDPEDPWQLLDHVDTAASRADGGLLLLYFVGHGAPDFDRQGQGLRLMTRHSAPPDAPSTYAATSQVSFRGVLDTIRRGKKPRPQPAAVVAVLDCCMADRGAADMTQLNSYFFLAAATRDRQAMAPPDADFPLFTGRLIELLENGAPEFGPDIRLADLAELLCRTMPEGAPVPKASGSAGHLVLAPNPHPEVLDRARPQSTRMVSTGLCPYPGLAAFTEQEQQWFHGRRYDADTLVISLTAAQSPQLPVVLTGASGAGKTSFVQAALRPRLAAAALEGAATHRHTTVLRPGSPRLVHDLARHLASLAPGADPTVFESRLRQGEHGARAVAREIQTAHATADGIPAELVLIVDQFEKVYGPDIEAPEQTAFISAVCALAAAEIPAPWRPLDADRKEDTVRVRVLLVVPSESSGRLGESDDRLRRALTTTQHILAPLSEDEVRRAIVEPARSEGIVPDEDFVASVCAEFASAAAPQYGDARADLPPARLLPYLAQALRATWERSPRDRLTLRAYQDSGRLQGAIKETAEKCYGQFDATDRDIAQVLLLHLVAHNDQAISDELKTVAREVLVQEASSTGDPNSRLRAEQVLDQLREHRLVVETYRGVTLVHRALVHAWPRMGRWIRDDRTWLTIRERIQTEARRWERDGRGDRSTPLSSFLADDFAAAAHRGGTSGLSQRDWDYLDATMASRDQEIRQRRLGRRRQRIAATISVLSCVACAAGIWFGVGEHRSSASARQEQTASRLASAAHVTAARQPDLAARLAVASYRAARIPTAWAALLENAARVRPTPLSNAVTSHLTGTRLTVGAGAAATVTAKGIALDATADGHRVAILPESAGVTEIAFGHRGPTLAGIDALGSVHIWDTTHPRRPPRVFSTDVPSGEPGSVTTSLTFSADDTFLAVTAGEEGSTEAPPPFAAEVWRIPRDARPSRERTLPDDYAVFTGSGTTLAVANGAGDWHLHDVARPGRPVTLPLVRRSTRATCFGPDGTTAAQVGGASRLWRLAGGDARSIDGFTAHGGSCSFSPDGRMLAVFSTTTEIWRLRAALPPLRVAVLDRPHDESTADAGQFGPDGSLLAVPGNPPRLWDVSGLFQPGLLNAIRPATAAAGPTAVDSSGTVVAIAVADGTVAVWRLDGHGGQHHLPEVSSPSGEQVVSQLDFSPDTTRLTITYQGDQRRTWDLGGPTPERVPDPPAPVLSGPAEASAGHRHIRAEADGSAVRLAEGDEVGQDDPALIPAAAGGEVTALAFNADGALLAVGDDQGNIALVRVGDHATVAAVAALPARSAAITSVAFGAGDRLLVGAADGTVLLSTVNPATLTDQICAAPLATQDAAQWPVDLADEARSACPDTPRT
ncbi:nSTAND1 domain-containing NTPase [Streptomyces europaeiscabiei]|uniref:nSTAND1 domain-containing NTPase n=1 Tax=Streptomyces europaeiscabiei TaxID=146819 RepID=UPI0038D43A88